MFRVDNATAAAALPTPGAVGPNPDSFFTDGDPVGGTPATVVPADWLNAVQEEISHVIEQAGDTLDKADRTQLYAAIVSIAAAAMPDASTTVKGKIEIATDAEAQALTSALLAITPASLKGAFQGSNQSFSGTGYQKIPGGFIIQWGATTSSASADVAVTFPVAFPNAVRAISVTPAAIGFGRMGNHNSGSTTGFNIAAWSAAGSRSADACLWIAIGN